MEDGEIACNHLLHSHRQTRSLTQERCCHHHKHRRKTDPGATASGGQVSRIHAEVPPLIRRAGRRLRIDLATLAKVVYGDRVVVPGSRRISHRHLSRFVSIASPLSAFARFASRCAGVFVDDRACVFPVEARECFRTRGLSVGSDSLKHREQEQEVALHDRVLQQKMRMTTR